MLDGCLAFSDSGAEIVGEGLVVVVNEIDGLEEATARADFACETGDGAIGALEGAVVVVDEVAEQTILPMSKRADAKLEG